MTTKRTTVWWTYVISGIALIWFVAPALISAADTFLVMIGILLLVLYGVWSWYLWIAPLIKRIGDIREL